MAEKKKVKFFWNDKEIEAYEGTNLLQAAKDNGIEVAHYCYHQGLSIAGVCRMCMVEQEGMPRLYPSCNATVQDGIKVRNDSEKVKKAVEATLQFHLVNHPLDCPICDQAGECGLQEYYMKHGRYDSEMIDKKVLKKKVQDIGCGVMLDSERCILCSRCVRFTKEVTKTEELGILNRGDKAEITVLSNLHNDYAQNVVDNCPVGALTSKDFRFKQRVWFLEDLETTCIGCETGCRVRISQNESGAYRVRPMYDHEVNGHWMCDEGRKIFKHVSGMGRLQGPMKNVDGNFLPTSYAEIKDKTVGRNVHFILSAGLTNEEYAEFFKHFNKKGISVALYSLPNEGEEFDGILKRSGKNPNMKGAEQAFKKAGVDASFGALNKLVDELTSDDIVYMVIPEIIYNQDHFKTLAAKLENAAFTVALTASDTVADLSDFDYLIPVPTFADKDGTIINYNDMERTLKKGKTYGDISRNVTSFINWTL